MIFNMHEVIFSPCLMVCSLWVLLFALFMCCMRGVTYFHALSECSCCTVYCYIWTFMSVTYFSVSLEAPISLDDICLLGSVRKSGDIAVICTWMKQSSPLNDTHHWGNPGRNDRPLSLMPEITCFLLLSLLGSLYQRFPYVIFTICQRTLCSMK